MVELVIQRTDQIGHEKENIFVGLLFFFSPSSSLLCGSVYFWRVAVGLAHSDLLL